MWPGPRAVGGLLAAFVFACGDPAELEVDAGPPLGPGTEITAQLIVESDIELALVFGETAPLSFRYVEADGSPIEDASVRLAILGSANDASLDSVGGVTDAEGRVQATVRAGTAASAFRVRASAERASPVSVEVSVGEGGFGDIRARLQAPANRQSERIETRLFTNRFCDDPAVMDGPGARVRTLGDGEVETTFATLPADVTYAVVGRALGPIACGEAILGWGCTDSINVAPNEVSFASVVIKPQPLDADGAFDVALVVGADVLTLAIEDALQSVGASSLLDAVETVLRRQGNASSADALAMARAEDDADANLSLALSTAGAGPAEFLSSLELAVASRIVSVGIDAILTVGTPSTAARQGTYVVGSDAAADRVDLAPTASVEGAALLRVERAPTDFTSSLLRFRCRSEPLRCRQSRHWPRTTGRIHSRTPRETNLAATFSQRLSPNCRRFATGCGDTCIEEACDDASDALVGDIRAALEPLNERRDEWRLAGEARLVDSAGILRVNQLTDGTVTGVWSAPDETESDPISGTVEGNRSLQ